jgi:hypothetical protein
MGREVEIIVVKDKKRHNLGENRDSAAVEKVENATLKSFVLSF